MVEVHNYQRTQPFVAALICGTGPHYSTLGVRLRMHCISLLIPRGWSAVLEPRTKFRKTTGFPRPHHVSSLFRSVPYEFGPRREKQAIHKYIVLVVYMPTAFFGRYRNTRLGLRHRQTLTEPCSSFSRSRNLHDAVRYTILLNSPLRMSLNV